MNKIIKFSKIVLEGKTLQDKLNIVSFFMGNPKELDLKNSDGLFHVRANKSDLWMCSPLGDLDMRKYFDLEEGTFIDVGANIGRYSIALAKRPKVHVIAFEPDPSNFDALKRNILLNNLQEKIEIFPIALSNKSGEAIFYINKENAGNSSLEMQRGQTSTQIKVRTERADNLVKEKVDFIKIDVEGAESLVLKGASNIIKKFLPKIIFEAENLEKLAKVKRVLEPFGYNIQQITSTDYIAKRSIVK